MATKNIPITNEFFEEIIDVCPKCKGLIKRFPVRNDNGLLSQTFKCKNKKCKFEKKIEMRI